MPSKQEPSAVVEEVVEDEEDEELSVSDSDSEGAPELDGEALGGLAAVSLIWGWRPGQAVRDVPSGRKHV